MVEEVADPRDLTHEFWNGTLYQMLGRIHLAMGNPGKAQIAYTRAIDQSESYRQSYEFDGSGNEWKIKYYREYLSDFYMSRANAYRQLNMEVEANKDEVMARKMLSARLLAD